MRDVMPGDRAESNKGYEAKREAENCERKGSEAVEKSSRDIMVIIKTHGNYESNRHT